MPSDEELLAFAVDAAFAALEGREGPPLDEAEAALGRIDESEVDYRDLIVARDVVRWAAEPAARDTGGMWRRIDATPSGDPTDDLEAQQFTVFLAEAATEEHAGLLAKSALSKDWHEALGVAHGRACAVTIARSWVDGVPALEAPGDLERFRAPFTRALEEAD